MKPKNFLFLLLAFSCTWIVLVSCSRRDLSTPSSRLVGHWTGAYGETYYGPIDKEKIGNYTEVDTDGNAVYYYYKVVSENISGDEIEIAISKADDFPISFPLLVSKDGLKLTLLVAGDFVETYVDEKIEPSP
jgi:hypothetical protein